MDGVIPPGRRTNDGGAHDLHLATRLPSAARDRTLHCAAAGSGCGDRAGVSLSAGIRIRADCRCGAARRNRFAIHVTVKLRPLVGLDLTTVHAQYHAGHVLSLGGHDERQQFSDVFRFAKASYACLP